MNIATKRIFFGHQSVGSNILEGVNDIMADRGNADRLHIVESRTPHEHSGPCLIHARVGENRDPVSKINDFAALMDDGFGNNIDIAGFKFCYIDIQEMTDVQHLFETYQQTMASLERKYRNTTFLHMTVPLRTAEHGLRRIAKNLLRKKSIAAAKNLKRQTFNELMIRHYGNSGRLFDLARAESTYPGGRRCRGFYNGNDVFSLVPQYTHDGGHLNNPGRTAIAAKFLDTLENLANN